MKRTLLAMCLALLIGCPPPPPGPPQTIPITSPGSIEAEGEWQVHVVRFEPIRDASQGNTGAPIQSALVAWISSWQNLELVDFEVAPNGNDLTGHDMVIVASKRR